MHSTKPRVSGRDRAKESRPKNINAWNKWFLMIGDEVMLEIAVTHLLYSAASILDFFSWLFLSAVRMVCNFLMVQIDMWKFANLKLGESIHWNFLSPKFQCCKFWCDQIQRKKLWLHAWQHLGILWNLRQASSPFHFLCLRLPLQTQLPE